MKPGDIILKDFRQSPGVTQPHIGKTCRMLQWNIERGYELDKVIEALKNSGADIIALQEVDIGCERSGSLDTGEKIAAALGMNYAFVCEFEELRSNLRNSRSQGGGFHGNAMLSRWDFDQASALEHRCHPVDWENPVHPLAKQEPRRGRRLSLEVIVATPWGPLVCYSCHLEVFCGMLARIAQISDVFKACRTHIDQGRHHLAILGDLNTMGHGIARLSPNFCCDQMRFRNLGKTEAQFWDENVISQVAKGYVVSQVEPAEEQNVGELNLRLKALGLSEDVCRNALNPGFHDPFDPVKSITLDNPAYRFWGVSLMAGKLDWILLRKCLVKKTSIGNHDYAASDHKWLMADVVLL